MSTQAKTFLTAQEYLEIERQAEFKSEFWQGATTAMAGASEAHNLIAANLLAVLHPQLRRRPCRVYPSDMRVHIPASGLYTYPDVTVVCDDPRFTDGRRDTLLNPFLLAEVLSPSTEAYDRGRKFEFYRAIDTLREYLLVAQDRVHVDLYRRQAQGIWLLRAADGLEETVELESIGCTISMAELYEKLELGTGQKQS